MLSQTDTLITVLIIGNHEFLNRSLQDAISLYSDIEIVKGVAGFEDAIIIAATRQPNVILIDLLIDEMENLTLVKQLNEAYSNIPIITMSGFPTDETVSTLLNNGVKHNITRGDSPETIVDVIRRVYQESEESR